jgi:hypothetical protein
MSTDKTRRHGKRWLAALGLGLAVLGTAAYFTTRSEPPAAEPPDEPPPAEATTAEVHRLCAACHAYPPADTFPKRAWRLEVRQGYDFFRNSNLRIPYPSLEAVVRYYESRAPEELPVLPPTPPSRPPVHFDQLGCPVPGKGPRLGVTNLSLGHLFDKRKLDLIVCDMHGGQVLALKPYEDPPSWHVLGKVECPGHAEVVDLDGDGIPDVLVADLGSLEPSNVQVGRVVWLRGRKDGTFTPYTLLEGVGRVADVQAADFRGTGKKDLVVAVFGWRTAGSILYLENQTTDWSRPSFKPRVLDERTGTIHVPVADLNGDGKPDFVALISQEHETVVAFLNEGGGRFRQETIYTAPHPAYGSSGIQLVDLNGDGKLDVLYTNGDSLDPPYLLKPYHSIQWLENPGKFPFRHHEIAKMYGVMRAVAADVSGHGRPDILAVSYIPPPALAGRAELRPDAVVLLEQISPGKFVRHSLETDTCDHYTCVAGAWNGDGVSHLATGSFSLAPGPSGRQGVMLWKNRKGPR